jgi:hypothetical protein
MEWECEFVMNNPEGYDGLMHQKAVCGNIRKRYFIAETDRLARIWEKHPITGAAFRLTDHLGITVP